MMGLEESPAILALYEFGRKSWHICSDSGMFAQLIKYGVARRVAMFKTLSMEYVFSAYRPSEAINIRLN